MPSKITNFLHDSVVAPNPAPVLGAAFDTADVHVHDLTLRLPAFQRVGSFSGTVEGIHVHLTSVAGGATKAFLKICLDANGDFAVVPTVEVPLDAGITTANSACVAVAVRLPVSQALGGTTVYLFARLDAGTATMAQSCITWRE